MSGRAGLVLTGGSIACTIAVAAAGPSLMEPPLPGAPGQPPWSFDARLSPYLAVGLAAAGLAAGTLGLALTLRALRAGWRVSPRAVLLAGVAAAVVAGTTRPFGTSDFLSYAAYGRDLVTGHNPYAVAPAALARLGDPVARAVQDWAGTPSVYGALASGVFGFASLAGGTSARLTVYVLGLVNAAAFVATGLLLDRMARGRPDARLRAALLWTCNPLLLQILVAGGHIDTLAVAFGVAAVAVAAPVAGGGFRVAGGASRAAALRGLAAGALVGLGFAVKPTIALIGAGIAITFTPPVVRNTANAACGRALFRVLALIAAQTRNKSWGLRLNAAASRLSGSRCLWPRRAVWRSPRSGKSRYLVVSSVALGFAAVAGADLALIGGAGFGQTLRASGMVSAGSPWRVVRTVLGQFMAEPVADQVVRAGATALALLLAVALLRGQRLCLRTASPNTDETGAEVAGAHTGASAGAELARGAMLAGGAAFALVLAWLVAWPYVLPWYDALAWALLPLLPASGFDWVLLARTAVLGFGYLPARSAGITIPPGLRWMEPAIRSAVTPAMLAAVAVFLGLVVIRRARSDCPYQA